MDLVFLHGPPAVGKLTVGRALAEATGLPLFHNHYVVDAVTSVFDFRSESARKLRELMWLAMFEEAAGVGQSVIFTFAPERTIGASFPDDAVRAVGAHGGRVRFVQLICSEAEQDRRVELESRRAFAKLRSAREFRELRASGWLDFGPLPAELVLDTGVLTPEEAARKIAAHLAG